MPDDTNPPTTPEQQAAENTRIEAARQQEKDKLYAEQQRLQSEVNASKSVAEQNIKLQAELDSTKARLAAIEKSSSDKGVDVSKLIAESTEIATKQFSATIEKLNQQVVALDNKARASELELIKKQIIEDANGEIVTGLLIGNTEAELRGSAERARAEFLNIKKRVSGQTGAPGVPATPTPATSGVQGSGVPVVGAPQLVSAPGDMRNWRQTRQTALAAIRKQFG